MVCCVWLCRVLYVVCFCCVVMCWCRVFVRGSLRVVVLHVVSRVLFVDRCCVWLVLVMCCVFVVCFVCFVVLVSVVMLCLFECCLLFVVRVCWLFTFGVC